MLLYRLPILNDLAVTLDHYKKNSVETLAPPQGVRFYLWLVTEYSENVVYLPRNCALAWRSFIRVPGISHYVVYIHVIVSH
jgi:hypothetical protein